VDGGILSNFPLWLFDKPNCNVKQRIPTLGFQLIGKDTVQSNKITGPITMLKALFETMMNAHDERYIEKHNDFRTIKIPVFGVSTTEFSISREKSLEVYEAGKAAGNRFFGKWSISNYLKNYDKYCEVPEVSEVRG
jgi:NTE family protein